MQRQKYGTHAQGKSTHLDRHALVVNHTNDKRPGVHTTGSGWKRLKRRNFFWWGPGSTTSSSTKVSSSAISASQWHSWWSTANTSSSPDSTVTFRGKSLEKYWTSCPTRTTSRSKEHSVPGAGTPAGKHRSPNGSTMLGTWSPSTPRTSPSVGSAGSARSMIVEVASSLFNKVFFWLFAQILRRATT